ncbi:FAD-dependent oxidoreductase [Enhygromyxa salina]|uniref:Acetoacetate decarboxylase (ADC) n=1 Tax=Enhygromyxa salina TaxID=215803 RepID=A0A2S9XF22_9BACT|nr:FAD-dependent oxidoreductase [Enhygromyxa salina]PRP91464.1 Acetoacetate decarboxylase (ADC) [Enhygromyxa salina]
MSRERIVILGGGMAALTAAFELTEAPNWQQHHKLTIYQSGHRLGGKGASSRAGDRFDRIEEHGLHLFYGFYDNAFSVMRRCYEQLDRPPNAPLATLEQALQPHSLIVFEEQRDKWQHQPLLFPRNSAPPGLCTPVPTPRALIPIMLRFLIELFDEQRELYLDRGRTTGAINAAVLAAARAAVAGAVHELEQLLAPRGTGLGGNRRDALLRRLLTLSAVVQGIFEGMLTGRPRLRAAWSAADLTLVMIHGMIQEGLIDEDPVDWRRLDHEDFRAWLGRHGANEAALSAASLAGVYAGAYSADIEIGAGTGLHWTLRMLYTYRGAIFYKMQAGMGEVIFAPLYLLLRRRGVEFRFFHRVDALRLSTDRRRIARVELARQIDLIGADYEPLIDVHGLPCWPSEPRYEQLVDGERLRASGELLEDWGSTWPTTPVCLEHGRDFDRLVLGVGLGCIPALCQELIHDDHNPRFGAMVQAVTTTMTASAQLWIREPLSRTGWALPPAVVIPYAEPLDTWADMSHLLEVERFPAAEGPQSVAYLTAAMADDTLPPTSRADFRDHARRQDARIRQLTAAHLERSAEHLWPQLCGATGAFDHRHLWAPLATPDPLAWQHFSPQQHPSDRYVRSPRDTTRLRLSADESGYDNLILAGDWTSTPMNLGCIEGATMSGIRAAQVLARSHRTITMHGDWLSGDASPGVTTYRPYIEREVNESTAPPYLARASTMFTALLPADGSRLQALCTRHLGLDDHRVYVPLGGHVIFYAQDNPHLSASNAPGEVHERDFGFMIPVAICERRDGRLEPEAIGAYVPYLWVDLGAAVIGGREVLGFPKGQGTLGFDVSPDGHVALQLDAFLPPSSGAGVGVAWQHQRVLDLRSAPAASARSSLADLSAALNGASNSKVLSSAGLDRRARLRVMQLVVKTLRSGALTMVFLKQYRDATRPEQACYQALVEAPIERLGPAHAERVLGGRVEMQLSRRVPVIEALGLTAEGTGELARIPVLGAHYMVMDFRIGVGEVVRSI